MKHHLFILLFLGGLSGAHAQSLASPSVEVVPGAIDSSSRIEAERLSAEGEFDRQVAYCYGRFAVNDCIAQSRTKQRAKLDALRQRELAINKASREKKVQAQLVRIRDNASNRPTDQTSSKAVGQKIEPSEMEFGQNLHLQVIKSKPAQLDQ